MNAKDMYDKLKCGEGFEAKFNGHEGYVCKLTEKSPYFVSNNSRYSGCDYFIRKYGQKYGQYSWALSTYHITEDGYIEVSKKEISFSSLMIITYLGKA